MMTTYPKLVKAIALDNHNLLLKFSNGEQKLYDFKPNLSHSFYKELQNDILFKKVKVVDGEIEWATGQDFCPNTLYEKSNPADTVVTN